MNYEENKKLINNIVNNEFNHIQNENLHGMENLEQYKILSNKVDEIQHKLYELLPKEYHHLIDELETKGTDKLCIEIRHYFKKGVAAGTSNLNFLRDLTGGTIFY